MTQEEHRSLNEDLMKMESFDNIAKKEMELLNNYDKMRRDTIARWDSLGLLDTFENQKAEAIREAGQKYMREALEKLPDFLLNEQNKGKQIFNDIDPYGEENW